MHRARFCVLTLAVAASLLLGAGIAVTQAMAATLTFNFTGDVTKVHEGLSPPFAVNSSPTAMTGSLILDTFDHNTAGKFQITSFNMNIEGKNFSQGSPSSLEVETKHGAVVSADVRVHTPIGPGDPRELFIKLHEPGALGAFTTVPSLSSCIDSKDKNEWRLKFEEGKVAGNITSMTMTAVPLPPSLILFGAGLVALVGLGARNGIGNWRQIRPSIT